MQIVFAGRRSVVPGWTSLLHEGLPVLLGIAPALAVEALDGVVELLAESVDELLVRAGRRCLTVGGKKVGGLPQGREASLGVLGAPFA